MNQYGKLVLWMGLILMALQIAFEWKTIHGIIFNRETGSGGFYPPVIPPVPGLFPRTEIPPDTPMIPELVTSVHNP